jgi:D-alanyl-D-alanine carboxypeptidase
VQRIRTIALVGVILGVISLGQVGSVWGAARSTAPAARPGAAPQFSTATQRALTSIAISGMGAANMPGMEVGVWVPGEGSLVEALGTSDQATGAPLTLSDHLRIASVSKTFTATAILELVDQHKLSLSDHLSSFIVGIPNGSRITIAELLNMTSGIYDYVNDAAVIRVYDVNPMRPFALKDVLAIIKRNKPMFAPGAKVVYDNSNYYLLGAIAAKVAHESLGRLITTQILGPLGMRHTSYPGTPTMPAPFSHGYINQPNFPLRDVTNSNPAFAGGAGAMISTLGDLKIWAKALATGSLLTPATHALQLKTGVLAKTPKLRLGYGLGITDINGFLGHDGAIAGYGTAMFYLPRRKATIVLIGNNNDLGNPTPLAPALAIAAYLFPKQFPNGL